MFHINTCPFSENHSYEVRQPNLLNVFLYQLFHKIMKHGNVLPRAKMVDESFGENCTEAIFVGAVTTPMYSDD